MMKKTAIFVFLYLISIVSFSQKYTISGYVEDSQSGERLIGAGVYDTENIRYGTITNSYGFYSLTLPKGTKINLRASFVGYTPQSAAITLTKDTFISFKLKPVIEIDEVIVSGKRNEVESTQMSRIDVPITSIKKMPVLLGEVDVLKTIQLLPGVQSGSEGTSGVYVRGGSSDQNLILLDGVPVYNANHLFGFFSVFNADAISDVSLIKGGFPARYGGRLSSVIDIRMKEGNMKEIKGEYSIGIISSKFTIEGPIKEDKTSFILSGRRTYVDVLAAPIISVIGKIEDIDRFRAGYFFHDLNAKINHKFSDKDRLYLSVYTGKDKAYSRITEDYDNYYDKIDFDLHWGNITTALRWNHVFSPKLFGNTTVTYSRFNFVTDISEEYEDRDTGGNYTESFSIAYLSGINDLSATIDFDYSVNSFWEMKFGTNASRHIFKPGVNSFRVSSSSGSDNIDTTFGSKNIPAFEAQAYLENNLKIGNRLKINAGVHASMFNVRDTTFKSLQPRFSARFLVNDKFSIKASYAEMQQYLHFLTNSTIGLPTDLWLPATNLVPPQHSTQYAAGVSVNLPYNLNLSVEGFYKDMENLIEYKEGAGFFSAVEGDEGGADIWEEKVEIGKGWSYGFEFLLKKDLGKLAGWIAYTYSKSERKFDNISFGQVFPYRYDRRHDISILLTYKLNDRIDFGMTWVYGTGNAVTLAQEQYVPISYVQQSTEQPAYDDFYYYYNAQTVESYGKRNNFRLPAYHRLDLGVNFTKKKKRGVRTWSVSTYNTYNRLNPFFVQFDGGFFYDGTSSENSTKRQLAKYSLFPLIPSVSYKFKF